MYVGMTARMFERDGAYITLCIHIHHGVLVEIPGFSNVMRAELDVQSVGVLGVLYFS